MWLELDDEVSRSETRFRETSVPPVFLVDGWDATLVLTLQSHQDEPVIYLLLKCKPAFCRTQRIKAVINMSAGLLRAIKG